MSQLVWATKPVHEGREHSEEWFEHFLCDVLNDLPDISQKNQYTCRMCFRTYVVPCMARDCEFDHFDDEPGCMDDPEREV